MTVFQKRITLIVISDNSSKIQSKIMISEQYVRDSFDMLYINGLPRTCIHALCQFKDPSCEIMTKMINQN
jgi:hypothetical protein